MKNGKKIKIKDMTDSHLLNTIAFLKRKCMQEVNQLINLPLPQGEIACMDVEADMDNLMEDPEQLLPDVYYDLEGEARGRGLNGLE